MPSPFVVQIDPSLADKLRQDLEEQGFSLSQPQYTLLQAKKEGVSCTLYSSGKLVVQGKQMASFIEFYLEPELLQTFNYHYPTADKEYTSHMGSDESGKGDFFGPLCIATLYASADSIDDLVKMGVKDSKKLSDSVIRPLAKKIASKYQHHIIKIGPLKYNELIAKFGNLNTLMGWAHATAIEALYLKTHAPQVIIDKFAHEAVIAKALKQKKTELSKLEVIQRTGAEEDPVVAGASILARAAFIEELERLSGMAHVTLPKGANQKCIAVGKQIVREHGKEWLRQVAKLHFKTTQAIFD